jgi:hypothetical protein
MLVIKKERWVSCREELGGELVERGGWRKTDREKKSLHAVLIKFYPAILPCSTTNIEGYY